MLQVFRKNSYSWVTRVLLVMLGGIFALFFGAFGVGSLVGGSYRSVARVGCYTYFGVITLPGCQTIMPEQIDDETGDLRRQFQNVYGQNAPQMLQSVNLRQLAVEQLIEQILIKREARRLGLSIGDDELARAIETQTAFQVDGRFNVERYNALLRDNELEPSVFETKTRNQMLTETMRQMVTQSIQASPAEVRREFNRFGEKLTLAYLEFSYSDFASKVNPTASQLVKYYQDNREQFREPERFQLDFVRYDPAPLAANETPSADEIQSFYDRNLKQFSHPEQVRARHILIALSANASPTEQAAAKAKAEDILAKVKAGADFAKLAGQYSDDSGTRTRGGELGTFVRGEMVKPFEDAAFQLKPGQFTLVQTQFGYHIIQVEEVKPASEDTLEQAKPKIIAALRQKQGMTLAKQDVEQDLAAALEGRTLNQLAQKRGLVAVETPYVAAGDSVKGAENDPKFLAEAFKLDKGEIRAITDTSEPYLVKLVDRKPAHTPSFDQIKDKVREAYVRQQAALLAAAAAGSTFKRIKSAADFHSVASADHLQIRTTPEFPRARREVPGIGEFPEATEAAASVPAIPGVFDRVLENGGNSYIFEVVSRAAPSEQEWKAEGPAFTEQFLQQRRAATWVNFVNDLKLRTPITVNPDLIGQSSEPSQM